MSKHEPRKLVAAAASRWPQVRQNYGNLAIPAVVAAVIAGKGGRHALERKRTREQSRASKR